MFRMPRVVLTLLVLALAVTLAGPLFAAGEGRMTGTVEDEAGNPIKGAKVTVTCQQFPAFREIRTTDKKGTFNIIFRQAALNYIYRIEKEGHQAIEKEIQGTSTRPMRETFVLPPAQAGATGGEAGAAPTSLELTGTNKAIVAYNAGLTAFKEGDLAEAEAKFQQAVAEDPDLGPAQVALGQVYMDQKKYSQAAAQAEKVLTRQPADRDALQLAYESYRAQGEKEKAEAASEALKAAEEGAETARRIYNEGADAFEAGDKDTALVKFQEASSLDPNLTEAFHAVATIQLEKKNYQEAAEAAERVLAVKPEQTKTLRVAHDAYKGLGNEERAQEILIQLATLDPTVGAEGLLEQGTDLFNANKLEEAKPFLESALEVDPSRGKAHFMLGLYYVNHGDSAAAREHFEKFMELEPDDPDVATAKEMLQYLQ